MITKKICEDLVLRAKRAGADDALLAAWEKKERGASVRNGEIEDVISNHDAMLTLVVWRDGHRSSKGTQDLSPAGIDEVLRKTIEMLPFSDCDPASGIAPKYLSVGKVQNLDLYDPEISRLTFDDYAQLAGKMERTALLHDPRIMTIKDSSASARFATTYFASTHGVSRSLRSSTISLSISPVAKSEAGMQRDYWYDTVRHISHLADPEKIACIAAGRTVRHLDPQAVKGGELPVIFEPEIASEFLGTIASTLSGRAIYLGNSFLGGRINQDIASPLLNIYDDATLPQQLGSRPFDGDGVISRPRTIIWQGKLASYLLDAYAARKLKMESTGHAGGCSNFYLAEGEYAPANIIESVKEGLLITEFMGFGVNLLTGDFSKGAKGIWIKDGELAYPVEGITVAGNLKDMLQGVTMVGNDLSFRSPISAPTIKISRMMITGSQ